MTNEKNSDEKQQTNEGRGINITRRSYVALSAILGGLGTATGVDAASTVIEDFERYDGTTTLDDVYSSSTRAFDVVTDTVFEGNQSLYSGNSSGLFINSTSGLDTYPSIGDTVEWYTWSRADAGDRLHFLPQSETDRDNHYSIDHSLRDDRMRLGLYVDGTSEYFAVDTDFTTTRDERWLRHRLETEDTGTAHAFTYELHEYNPSGEDTLLNSISGIDAEASISDGQEFSTGGIGWLVYGGSGTERWFDRLTKVDDRGGGGGGSLSVTTDGATDVAETSATLNGSLTDLGGADSADVSFEWGPSGGLSNATTPQALSATGRFSEELTGLDSGADYEFRAIAEASDGGTDTGDILTFATDVGQTVPEIDRIELTDIGNPTWAWVEVDWAVSDAGGDLNAVETAFALGGSRKGSETTSVSGSSASGIHRHRERDGQGQTYDVTLTVTDANGNSTSETKQIDL
ncbi:hypothetical protein [Halorubrum sp. CSM-61]|uniref:hypothetical protein n=1 Tax=Halorubrum sp. CSM-61 TaxID=2485838 RepID=UPI000F4D26DC|nr:hypothetical protein [Halorubrum sp. CSM-61]